MDTKKHESEIYDIRTRASGPIGALPITEEMLLKSPSGDLFGLSQNAGMGWNPAEVGRKQFLILSTQGGVRAPDGTPIALGYHTGHWEIGLLVQAAAEEFRQLQTLPFAGLGDLPCVVVPGGVTLPPSEGEDAGAVQTLGTRYARGLVSLSEAAELG